MLQGGLWGLAVEIMQPVGFLRDDPLVATSNRVERNRSVNSWTIRDSSRHLTSIWSSMLSSSFLYTLPTELA